MKPKYYITVILTLIWIFSTTVTRGQNGTVSGRVVEKGSNESLVGVNVYLKCDHTKGTVTNYNGFFQLEIPAGKHTLEISYTGMKPVEVPVDVIKDSSKSLKTIRMVPVSYTVDELVVRAGVFNKKISEQTTSINVMKSRIINVRNTRNVTTVLNLVPGVTILDEEPQIRGGSGFTYGVGAKVGVFVDGMPIASADAGKPDWTFVPVENIKKIEVKKGAASVLSGSSSLNGAIYIRFNYPGLKPQTNVKAYFGTYTTPSGDASKWWNGLAPITGVAFSESKRINHGYTDFVIGGTVLYDHDYQGPPKVSPPVVDSSGITNSEMANRLIRLNFNFRHRLKNTEGLTIGLNGNFIRQKNSVAMAWLDDTTGFYRGYPGAILNTDRFTFYVDPIVSYFSKRGAKHELANRIMVDYSNANLDQSNRSMVIYNRYEFRKQFFKTGNFDLVMGIVSDYNYVVADMYKGSGFDHNNLWNLSMYGEIEKRFKKFATVSLGARLEYFSLNSTINKFKPIFRFGSTFSLTPGTFLRASIGMGYRFPTIAERYVHTKIGAYGVFDNPGLVPESSWSAEVGIKQGIKIKKFMAYADLALFYQKYSNTIEYLFGFWDSTYTFAYAGFKFVNTGKSYVTGIDFSLNGQVQFNRHTTLNLMAGYTYVRPVTLEPDKVFAHDYNPGGSTAFSYTTTSVNPESHILKYRFLHTAKLDMELDFYRFAVGTSARYYSKIINLDKAIFDFEDATRATGGTIQAILYRNYFYNHNNGNMIWDVRLSYKLSKTSKIAVLCNNLFNRMYSLRPLKAEPVRSVMLRYSLDL